MKNTLYQVLLLSQDTSAFSLGFTALKTSALAMTANSREIVRMVTSFQAMAGMQSACESPNSVFFFLSFPPLFEDLEPKEVGWTNTGEKKTKHRVQKHVFFFWGGGGEGVLFWVFCWCFPSKKETWVCETVETLLKLLSSAVQDPSTVYTIYGIYYTKHPIYEVQVPENCVVEEDILKKRFC